MWEGEKPRRFKRLCLRALSEGAISESKAAALLGISVRELNRRMQEPPESETLWTEIQLTHADSVRGGTMTNVAGQTARDQHTDRRARR